MSNPVTESDERLEPDNRSVKLPPGKLEIIYMSGFPPFWRRDPDAWLIEPQEWRKKRLPLQWLRSLGLRR